MATVKVNITSLATGQYLLHVYVNGNKKDVDSGATGIDPIELGGRSYFYENRNFGSWNRQVLTIA